MTRDEVLTLFARFVHEQDFSTQDLCVLGECCLRELSARSVLTPDEVSLFLHLLQERAK